MAKKKAKSKVVKEAGTKQSKRTAPKTAKKPAAAGGKKTELKKTAAKSKSKPAVKEVKRRTLATKEKTSKVQLSEGSTGGPTENQAFTTTQNTEQQDEMISRLAYSKWEEAGCPDGDGVEFWLATEREVLNCK